MLSTAQAAERLGITRQAVFNLIQRGALTADRVGRAWLVHEDSVERRIRDQKKETAPERAA
jgi:excisionase family DNA binding protein